MTQETQVKPTPGTWQASATEDGMIFVASGDRLIARVITHQSARETDWANACLIAAAHDTKRKKDKLLSAAKQALTHSDKETLFGRCGFCLGWLEPGIEDRGCDEDCAGRMLREAVEEAE